MSAPEIERQIRLLLRERDELDRAEEHAEDRYDDARSSDESIGSLRYGRARGES